MNEVIRIVYPEKIDGLFEDSESAKSGVFQIDFEEYELYVQFLDFIFDHGCTVEPACSEEVHDRIILSEASELTEYMEDEDYETE